MSTWSLEDGSESSQNKINLHLKVLLLQICLDNSQTWILVLIFFTLLGFKQITCKKTLESFIPCNKVCSTFQLFMTFFCCTCFFCPRSASLQLL